MKIDETKSICKESKKAIPADIITKKGRVYIKKKCPQHGISTELHVWDIPETYNFWKNLKFYYNTVSNNVALNLTNRCNLNCNVCYSQANKLQLREYKKRDLHKLKPYKYIYLTGGEPTVREDIIDIIKILKKNKHKVAVFTNGIKLGDGNFAKKIKKAKVDFIYLQLDSVSKEYNTFVRGYDDTTLKKKVLDNLRDNRIFTYPISLSLKSQTSKEIKDFILFCLEYENIIVIGFNPVWETGKYLEHEFTSTSDTIEKINKAIGSKTRYFLDSTRLLINFETLCMIYKKRKRRFGKCNLFYLIMYDRGKIIPINKIFNMEKMNTTMEMLIQRGKDYPVLTAKLLGLIFSEFFINFFRSRYYRKLVFKTICNIRHLFINPYLFSPLRIIRINSFPNLKNADLYFMSTCNLLSINEDFNMEPACVYRFCLND